MKSLTCKRALLLAIGGLIFANSTLAQVSNSASNGLALNQGNGAAMQLQHFTLEEAAIEIDGLVDEAVWSRIKRIDDMRVIVPDTLEAVPYDTDVKIFYTDRGLYLGFDMQQPLDTLVQRISTRDNLALSRDRVGVTLDMSGEGLFGYWMMLALGDNQIDGTILPERQYNSDWDGAWYGATSTTDKGWSAEFFLPWGQMAMPREDEARQIGIYVERGVAHLDQAWARPAMTALPPATARAPSICGVLWAALYQ